jgi:DNA adenine methylase
MANPAGVVLRGPGVAARRGFNLVASLVRSLLVSNAGFGGGIPSAVRALSAIAGIVFFVGVGLDSSAVLSDAAGMSYTGGKNGSGVYQRIINLMPPHRVYIEPFLGSGAIFRLKRPADRNIGLDLNPDVIADFAGRNAGCDAVGRYRQKTGYSSTVESSAEVLQRRNGRWAPSSSVHCGDASSFLRDYRFQGDELVYCDPPYLLSTRKTVMRDAYPFEMRDVDHREFLRCIRTVGRKAKVIISGYYSEMYASVLDDWKSTQFQAVTRGGTLATEWLWYNYPTPTVLHDYSYLGENYRERERIKRKKRAWVNRLAKMPRLERQALLAAFNEVGNPAGWTGGPDVAGGSCSNAGLDPTRSHSAEPNGEVPNAGLSDGHSAEPNGEVPNAGLSDGARSRDRNVQPSDAGSRPATPGRDKTAERST